MVETLLLTVTLLMQPVATPTHKFAFDYSIADFSNFSVTHFERQLDGSAWAQIAVTVQNDALTPVGSNTHVSPIPALTPGMHTVGFRACNVAGCSSPLELGFRLVVVPPAASGLRIVIK